MAHRNPAAHQVEDRNRTPDEAHPALREAFPHPRQTPPGAAGFASKPRGMPPGATVGRSDVSDGHHPAPRPQQAPAAGIQNERSNSKTRSKAPR